MVRWSDEVKERLEEDGMREQREGADERSTNMSSPS